MRIKNSVDRERGVPCLVQTTGDRRTRHLKPEVGEETTQENREDRRDEDDRGATIMIHITNMRVASCEGPVCAWPSRFQSATPSRPCAPNHHLPTVAATSLHGRPSLPSPSWVVRDDMGGNP